MGDGRLAGREVPFPARLRRLLFLAFWFGGLALGAELLLIGHYEDPWQWVPLVLLAFGFLSGLGIWWRPGAVATRVFRGLMAVWVLSGVVGMALHLKGNAEFEREMVPSLGGIELIWESLRGATPVLAPGAMVQLGLLGWATTILHPRHKGGRA